MSNKESKDESGWVRRVKRDFNIRAVKFRDAGRRGAPDRQVFMPHGKPLFIEQKLPGEPLHEDQKDYRAWLQKLGYTVVTCYSADDAYRVVKARLFFLLGLAEGSE